MTYIEICIMVLCFCMSVYFSRIKYSVEDIAEVLYAQAVLGRLLSIIIIATIAFFITPFFFVVICSITENTGMRFTAETLVNFFFGWMCIVAISSCFGYILGSVFKKNYIYLIVIPYVIFFSYLNSNFLSLFIDVNSELHLLLTNLFSIQDPFTTGIKLDYVSSMLAYLPQEFKVYPGLKTKEILGFVAELRGIKRKLVQREIDTVSTKTNITEYLTTKFKHCSGGIQRRIGIACTMIGDQELVLLDEPTVGIDPKERTKLYETLKTCFAGKTVILL